MFNSLPGLEYIQESLESTLLSEVGEDRLPFQGLPVGIVLAHDPSHTEKDLLLLRDGGQALADRLVLKGTPQPRQTLGTGPLAKSQKKLLWASEN